MESVVSRTEQLERLAGRLEAQVLALEAASARGQSSASFDSFKASLLASLHDLQAIVTLEEAQRTEVRRLAFFICWPFFSLGILPFLVVIVCLECA
jgi:hypothetical protein